MCCVPRCVQGALACKMLSWEDPLAQQLRDLRATEAKYLGQMLRIRAINMAIQVRPLGPCPHQRHGALHTMTACTTAAVSTCPCPFLRPQFITIVLITFTTFAVYRARNGTLQVASVFYAVALLQIPRMTMWAFVQGELPVLEPPCGREHVRAAHHAHR